MITRPSPCFSDCLKKAQRREAYFSMHQCDVSSPLSAREQTLSACFPHVSARLREHLGGLPVTSPLCRRCRCCRRRFLVWTAAGRLRFPCKTGVFPPRLIHKSFATNAFRPWRCVCKRLPFQPWPEPSVLGECLRQPAAPACPPPPSHLAAVGLNLRM